MRVFSSLWRRAALMFDPFQNLFNGDFWKVFEKNFASLGEGRVLDLGCGTGELLAHIKPRQYLGMDMNSSYIKFAKKRFRKNKNTDFVIGDITREVPKGNFDSAFFISTAHHLSDEELRSLCKIFSKAGIKRLILVDGYPVGPLSRVLAWLDGFLAGGRYFRKKEEIVKILGEYFKIEKEGEFGASGSFYVYPFVVAKNE